MKFQVFGKWLSMGLPQVPQTLPESSELMYQPLLQLKERN